MFFRSGFRKGFAFRAAFGAAVGCIFQALEPVAASEAEFITERLHDLSHLSNEDMTVKSYGKKASQETQTTVHDQ